MKCCLLTGLAITLDKIFFPKERENQVFGKQSAVSISRLPHRSEVDLENSRRVTFLLASLSSWLEICTSLITDDVPLCTGEKRMLSQMESTGLGSARRWSPGECLLASVVCQYRSYKLLSRLTSP